MKILNVYNVTQQQDFNHRRVGFTGFMGLGNEIELDHFDEKKITILGLNKMCLNFEDEIIMGCCLAIFHTVRVKTYGINYIYWSSLPNYLTALFVSLVNCINSLFLLVYYFHLLFYIYVSSLIKAYWRTTRRRLCFASFSLPA